MSVSCVSKKRATTTVEQSISTGNSTTLDGSRFIHSIVAESTDTTKLTETIYRKTETEYVYVKDSVTGSYYNFPSRIILTETIVKETEKGVRDIHISNVDNTDIKYTDTTNVKLDTAINQDVTYQKANDPVKTIYAFLLTIACVLIAGYIVLKRYFPSIFVKVFKHFLRL